MLAKEGPVGQPEVYQSVARARGQEETGTARVPILERNNPMLPVLFGSNEKRGEEADRGRCPRRQWFRDSVTAGRQNGRTDWPTELAVSYWPRLVARVIVSAIFATKRAASTHRWPGGGG